MKSPEFNDTVVSRIARDICDSESFMWLMVGSNHPEVHLASLREAYKVYRENGGGYGTK